LVKLLDKDLELELNKNILNSMISNYHLNAKKVQ